MLATDNGGEMLLTTSILQIVLFKYAKGISRKLNSAWQASRFSSKILRLLRVGNENMMVEKIICNQSDQNVSKDKQMVKLGNSCTHVFDQILIISINLQTRKIIRKWANASEFIRLCFEYIITFVYALFP